MRFLLAATLSFSLVAVAHAQEPPKMAPKIVLQSPDGKKQYDLAKLVQDGPVLVRLTCACTGCDAECNQFKKLQEAYNNKLQTIAVFREKPEDLETYAVKKGLNFMYLSDPKGEMWKTFDSKAMPTNILIDKGGAVVRIIPGCTRDGKNAQTLSNEVARLLNMPAAQIVAEATKK